MLELIISGGLVVFQLTLFILFTKNAGEQSRIKKKLSVALFIGILAAISRLFAVLYGNSINLLALSDLLYGVMYITLYLFFEDGTSMNPPIHRFAAIISVGTLSVFYSFTIILTGKIGDSLVDLIGNVARPVLGIVVFAFGTYTLKELYVVMREKVALIQMIGSTIIILGFVAHTLSKLPSIRTTTLAVTLVDVADAVILIGLFTLIIFYIINPRYIERIPTEVYTIFAFDPAGIGLNTAYVQTKGIEYEHHTDPQLIAMLTQALLGFVKQVTGSDQELELIVSKNRVVLFATGKVSIAILAQRVTSVIMDGIKSLRNIYAIAIEDKDHAKAMEKELFIANVQKVFPYLEVVNINTQ